MTEQKPPPSLFTSSQETYLAALLPSPSTLPGAALNSAMEDFLFSFTDVLLGNINITPNVHDDGGKGGKVGGKFEDVKELLINGVDYNNTRTSNNADEIKTSLDVMSKCRGDFYWQIEMIISPTLTQQITSTSFSTSQSSSTKPYRTAPAFTFCIPYIKNDELRSFCIAMAQIWSYGVYSDANSSFSYKYSPARRSSVINNSFNDDNNDNDKDNDKVKQSLPIISNTQSPPPPYTSLLITNLDLIQQITQCNCEIIEVIVKALTESNHANNYSRNCVLQDSGFRLGFMGLNGVEGLVFLVGFAEDCISNEEERAVSKVSETIADDASTSTLRSSLLIPTSLTSLYKLQTSLYKAITYMQPYPETLQILKRQNAHHLYINAFKKIHKKYMLVVDKDKKGRDKVDYAKSKVKSKAEEQKRVAMKLIEIDGETDFESNELKESYNKKLTQISKELRVYEKNLAELTINFRLIEFDFLATCEAVNCVGLGLSVLCDGDQAVQSFVIEGLGGGGDSSDGDDDDMLMPMPMHVMTTLLLNGSRRTLYTALHVIGSLTRLPSSSHSLSKSSKTSSSSSAQGETIEQSNHKGLKSSKHGQKIIVNSGVLRILCSVFKRLVLEDQGITHKPKSDESSLNSRTSFRTPARSSDDFEAGGENLEEWRHCLEIMFWCCREYDEAVYILRKEGMVRLLLELSIVELPFGLYKVEGDDAGNGDDDGGGDKEDDGLGDGDGSDDDDDINKRPLTATRTTTTTTNENNSEGKTSTSKFTNAKLQYKPPVDTPVMLSGLDSFRSHYVLPDGHIQDPMINSHTTDYFYCSRILIPSITRGMFKGNSKLWKMNNVSDDDGTVYTSHLLAVMCSMDALVQEELLGMMVEPGCVGEVGFGGVGVLPRVIQDVAKLVIPCDFFGDGEGERGEDEKMIDIFFEFERINKDEKNEDADDDDDLQSLSTITTAGSMLNKNQVPSTQSQNQSQVSKPKPTLTKSFPAISVLIALTTHRLNTNLWGNCTALATLLAALSSPPRYWSDRYPSRMTHPHMHLKVHEVSALTFEVCLAIIDSGGGDLVSSGLSLIALLSDKMLADAGGSSKKNLGFGSASVRTSKSNATVSSSASPAETRKALLGPSGPDALPLLSQFTKLLGRLCLSHETLRDDVVACVVKDKAEAANVPGSSAGGSSNSVSNRSYGGASRSLKFRVGSVEEKAKTQEEKAKTQYSYKVVWRVLIESMINGVRLFTGTGDGVQHSSTNEVYCCDLNIKIEACLCLASLCEGHGLASQSFAETGAIGLRALVFHAGKSSPPELQAQACRCLYAVSVFKHVRQRLAIEMKALAVILLLLHSNDPDVVLFACCAIERIAGGCHPAQQFINEYKGLLPFLRITGSGEWGVEDSDIYTDKAVTLYKRSAKAAACKAVAAIVARHIGNRDLAHHVKLTPNLVTILLKGDQEERKSVINTFTHLLQHNTTNRDILVQQGGVEALALLCRLGVPFLKSTAALQMKILCGNSNDLTSELAFIGGVIPLVSMLVGDDVLMQRHAAQTISGLILNKHFLEEVIRCGGILGMIDLLGKDDDETITYACITLGRAAACSEVARKIAYSNSVLPMLVEMASGSREKGKQPDSIKFMDGGDFYGKKRESESKAESGDLSAMLIAARGSGLGEDLNRAMRCTREAAIAMGNFGEYKEEFILDGSSNFIDGRMKSGMLPVGLLAKAPITHQPTSAFAKKMAGLEELESGDDDDENNGVTEYDELGLPIKKKKVEVELFVPEIAKRLASRTEEDKRALGTAYINRQELLRKRNRRIIGLDNIDYLNDKGDEDSDVDEQLEADEKWLTEQELIGEDDGGDEEGDEEDREEEESEWNEDEEDKKI